MFRFGMNIQYHIPNLLRNSGGKKPFTVAWTIFTICSEEAPSIMSAPKLEVIKMMVFLKSTFLPWLSVKCPSSKICRQIIRTSWWAFSMKGG